MIPFIRIGPLILATYGLMLGTGAICAYYLLRANCRRQALPPLTPVTFLLIPACAVFGAKLAYLLGAADLPLDELASYLNPIGFTSFGGALGAIVGVQLYAWSAQVPLLALLDAASPALSTAYACIRIGCLLSGDGDYGVPTTLPWGMSFPHGLVPTFARVHPTPLYEALAAAALAVVLWRLGGFARRGARRPGLILACYLLGSGLSRLLVEFIRLNPRGSLGLTDAQLLALGSIALGAALLATQHMRGEARLRLHLLPSAQRALAPPHCDEPRMP